MIDFGMITKYSIKKMYSLKLYITERKKLVKSTEIAVQINVNSKDKVLTLLHIQHL
jgi:hypothetical protein